MTPMTRLLSTGMLAGILLATGCGKSDDQPTRFNETLGGTPAGAPIATGSIDTGILKDPADYQPTPYDSLEGEAPTGPAGAAGGPEAEEIRTVISGLVDGVFHLETDTVLDMFVPEQVAALREEDEYITNLDELSDALRAYAQAITDKASGRELETFARVFELLPELAEPLLNAFAVSIVDEENAVATFDLARLEIPEELLTTLMELAEIGIAMAGQMGTGGFMGGGLPGAAAPNGATPPGAGDFSPEMLRDLPSVEIPLPLRKVDDTWRLELPFTIEEQHAELISEGALVFRDFLTDYAQAVGQVETLDMQTSAQIEAQVGMRHMGPIIGWVARAKLAAESLMESQPQPEEEATEPEADEAEPNEPEEEAPAEPPTGRRDRSRRP